jgi:hypothetical protein
MMYEIFTVRVRVRVRVSYVHRTDYLHMFYISGILNVSCISMSNMLLFKRFSWKTK